MTRHDLYAVAGLRERIALCSDRLQQIRTLTYALRGPGDYGDKVQTSKTTSPLEEAVVRLVDEENRIYERIGKMARRISAIAEAIEMVDDAGQLRLLRLRFVRGLSQDAAAKELGYTQQHVSRCEREAIAAFEAAAKDV